MKQIIFPCLDDVSTTFKIRGDGALVLTAWKLLLELWIKHREPFGVSCEQQLWAVPLGPPHICPNRRVDWRSPERDPSLQHPNVNTI